MVILIVLGVHSCQVSARNSALRTTQQRRHADPAVGRRRAAALQRPLDSGRPPSNATNLQNQINELRLTATNQLHSAQSLSVPDAESAAQTNFVLTLQMRADGIANIAQQIQPALGTTTSKDAINSIAAEMARLYASDVVYKDYTHR